jgi:hypothetical protein
MTDEEMIEEYWKKLGELKQIEAIINAKGVRNGGTDRFRES